MRFVALSFAASLSVLFLFAPPAYAACTAPMVPTPPEVRRLSPEIPECVLPDDIELFKREGFGKAGEAIKLLSENVCPGFEVGYNASIPPAQLKEKYVYFQYPSGDGKTVTMSASSLRCFANALKAMQAAGLPVCISAAFRSPAHQNASCNDRTNRIVCGRTAGGGCSGSYGSCPHVTGRAMDFDDKRTCQPGSGKPNNGCGLSPDFAAKMRQAAATAGARATAPSDLPHLECTGAGPANIPNNGYVGPPSGPYGPSGPGTTPFGQGGIPGLMQGLGNFFSPPQPQQCQAGYILMNGSCMPQQIAQTNSPYSYMNPPTPTPSPTPSTGSTSPVTNTGSTGGTSVDIGSGINISGLIDESADKKKGTTTAAIDLISAIANPTTTSSSGGVTIGKSVALNDSLENKATLDGTLASSSKTLSGSSTYVLNPYASQTFVSEDLSKTPVKSFSGGGINSTFALLERIRQILVSILQMFQPFGGRSGVSPANANQMLPYVE